MSSPILNRIFAFILLPLVVAAVCLLALMELVIPDKGGFLTVHHAGMSAVIHRSDEGIPAITADDQNAAFFALGYVHAQDRFWQMERSRRLAQGRLSEVIGIEGLESDRYMRTLGLSKAAEEVYRSLTHLEQAGLEKYSAGVNEGLRAARVLPYEFYQFGYAPDLWRPQDSILILKLFSFSLSSSYAGDLLADLSFRSIVAGASGIENRSNILGDAPPALGNTPAQVRLKLKLVELHQSIMRNPYLLKNDDTELSFAFSKNSGSQQPAGFDFARALQAQSNSSLYSASIRYGGSFTEGLTLPGLPLFFKGHNEQVAWAGVPLLADTQDVYVEQLNPLDNTQYRSSGEWKTLAEHHEEIVIRPGFPAFLRPKIAPYQLSIRSTENGPLVSDVVELADYPLALKFAGLSSADTSYTALLQLNRARDWESFTSALAYMVAPAMVFQYADASGNVGLREAGHVLKRTGIEGSFPVAVWQARGEQVTPMAFEAMLSIFNPADGYVFAANSNGSHISSLRSIHTSAASLLECKKVQADTEEACRESVQNAQAVDFLNKLGLSLPLKISAAPGSSETLPAAVDREESPVASAASEGRDVPILQERIYLEYTRVLQEIAERDTREVWDGQRIERIAAAAQLGQFPPLLLRHFLARCAICSPQPNLTGGGRPEITSCVKQNSDLAPKHAITTAELARPGSSPSRPGVPNGWCDES